MINDFDGLMQRCKIRALKRALGIALRILSSIVLVTLGVLGYYQWEAFTQPAVMTPKSHVNTPLAVEVNTSKHATIIPKITTVPSTPAPVATSITSAPPITAVPNTPTPPAQSNRLLEVSSASSNPMTPEQLYQRSPKFDTALAIARDFYTKEDYAQAALWAKKANQMNREAEEAWLLYAKSYYAQGKKNEAIGVLELFLNYKDSKAAADLIKSWR